MQGRTCCDFTVAVVFMDIVHKYPDIRVYPTLFNVAISKSIPQKVEHNDIMWIAPKEIKRYTFCPAYKEVLEKIIEVYNG